MSVTTEDVSQEEQQIQEENQENVSENGGNPESNTPESNQESIAEFEKSKGKLEYISIVCALIGLISTGLVKVLSLGRYICFYFDIDNCEFKLTNTDFIILFISLFCCGSAILYCYLTNSWRIKISDKINACFDSQAKKIIKIKKILGFIFLYIVYILIYLILGCFLIYIVTTCFSALEPIRSELIAILSTTFSFVIFMSCFTLKENKKQKTLYLVIIALFLLVGSFSFVKNSYDSAVNQKEFEIITLEDNNVKQTYAVISRGSSYSAYQCYIDKENNVLIINTDMHRYFPIDDTATRLYDFKGYKFVEYK